MPKSLTSPKEQESTTHYVGNWEILKIIGTGASGTVHEAQHRSVAGTKTAIKILHQKISSDPKVIRYFLRETSAASRACHDNIVRVLDSGISEAGYCYIVMELLSGITLSEFLRKKRLTIRQVVRIATQVAAALAVAHHHGVVHRDIKPDNILITSQTEDSECLKIVDFGVAKFLDSLDTSLRTKTGMWVGTRAYMSPEQWIAPGDIDGRADIYALGIILYECLTGFLPFSANTDYEWLIAHTEQRVPEPPTSAGIPAALSILVQQMLAKDRAQRPATMLEVVSRLNECYDPGKSVYSSDQRHLLSWAGKATLASLPFYRFQMATHWWLLSGIISIVTIGLLAIASMALTRMHADAAHTPWISE